MAGKKSREKLPEGKKEREGINNLELDRKNNFLIVSINPKIYPLEVIYSAAYVFLDRAYVIIDGNPEEEVFVQMKPKENKEDLEKLGMEFNNELVNYAVYVVQATRNQPLRKAIIERALLTNLGKTEEVSESAEKEYCEKCGCEMIFCEECKEYYCPACEEKHEEEERKAKEEEEKEFFVDDPLGIAKPWKPPEGDTK